MRKYIKPRDIAGILMILFSIFVVSLISFKDSLKRERDYERLIDMGNVVIGLERFKLDYDTYPLSDANGNIVACIGERTDYIKDRFGNIFQSSTGKLLRKDYISCTWGKDPLESELYLSLLPEDPQSSLGVSYAYFSDGKTYKLYGSYEGKSASGYDLDTLKQNIKCGSRFCNVIKASK